MSPCTYCEGHVGWVFAYPRRWESTELPAPTVFRCWCDTGRFKYQKAIPQWEASYGRRYTLDPAEVKLNPSPETGDTEFDVIFEKGDFESDEFNRALTRVGREKLVDMYRQWKNKR